ncbi:MAG: signal peptidase [Gaiellaceae bacterium]|nr:signal peptidase [Gaiellaceae bacterium]
MTEEAPRLADLRVGSAADGLTPIAGGTRSFAANSTQWIALAAVALFAAGCDQLTKWLVSSELGLGDAITVFPGLALHHVQNTGIAFGFFAGATPLVIVATAAVVVWMLLFFARSGGRHPILPAALGLLVGGSLSNLVDRIRLGHVVDFVEIPHWPAFNLADSVIVVGVAVLVATLVWSEREPRRRAR